MTTAFPAATELMCQNTRGWVAAAARADHTPLAAAHVHLVRAAGVRRRRRVGDGAGRPRRRPDHDADLLPAAQAPQARRVRPALRRARGRRPAGGWEPP